ncbi:MAG: nitroreductase family protein [Candidatus Nanopelagicaceae bacterium]
MHPLLQERWSPRSFDENIRISSEDLLAILEAGRWSPSSNNFQPWRFIVAKNGFNNFVAISETLSGFNREWAPRASAFIVLTAVMFDDSNQPRNQSLYDLGIASAYMTLEANNRGLAVHQVGGFDREAIRESFQLSEEMTPVAILVIGKQAEAEILSHENLITREKSSRVRKDFSELILSSD